MKQFIAIFAHAWCNDSGHGIGYDSTLLIHETREGAIEEGYQSRNSDDFNVGVVVDGKLVSLDWMDKVVEDSPEMMLNVSEQIGLV